VATADGAHGKDRLLRPNQLFADTITLRDLYKKHHWQVAGHTFYQLHLLFDKTSTRRRLPPPFKCEFKFFFTFRSTSLLVVVTSRPSPSESNHAPSIPSSPPPGTGIRFGQSWRRRVAAHCSKSWSSWTLSSRSMMASKQGSAMGKVYAASVEIFARSRCCFLGACVMGLAATTGGSCAPRACGSPGERRSRYCQIQFTPSAWGRREARSAWLRSYGFTPQRARGRRPGQV